MHVIPVKAIALSGIHKIIFIDSRLRGNDEI